MDTLEKRYTVDKSAEILGVRPCTVRRWVLLRRIGYFKTGRRVLIPASELARLSSFVPAREVSHAR